MREWVLWPVAPVIVDDDPEVAREVRDLGAQNDPCPDRPGTSSKRLALTGLLVVDLGVADRDLRHGRLAVGPGVVHPHGPLDRDHVGRPRERRRRRITRLRGAGRSP